MTIQETLQAEIRRVKKQYGSMQNYRNAMAMRQIGASTEKDNE